MKTSGLSARTAEEFVDGLDSEKNEQTPQSQIELAKRLRQLVWNQLTDAEEYGGDRIEEDSLYPLLRDLGTAIDTFENNIKKNLGDTDVADRVDSSKTPDEDDLGGETPDMSSTVAADRLAELDLNTRVIDRTKLTDSQKSILRRLVTARNNALTNLKKAAQLEDASSYQFNYNVASSVTKTIKRFVANTEVSGEDYTFGSGEEDRIKNFVIFEDSIVLSSTGDPTQTLNGEDKVARMEGLYVAKSGKVYAMRWDGQTSSAYVIKKDGTISATRAGYVNTSWSGESSRGPDFKRSVTPAYLKTYDSYRRDGIAGANITFARLAIEKSGRHFAHSSSLTPMGANNSKGLDANDPDRHYISQTEKVLWMMKAPIFDVMRDNGWFAPTKTFRLDGSRPTSISMFDLPIDPSGNRNGKDSMVGPFYKLDLMVESLADGYKSKKRNGQNIVAGVDYPEFMKDYVENTPGKTQSKQLRRVITDMSYKDGMSVDDAIGLFKEQSSQIADFRGKILDELRSQGISEYSLDRITNNIDGAIEFITETVNLLENNKEKLDDPSNRVERPKPFAKDSFKLVKKNPYGDVDAKSPRLQVIGKNSDLVNDVPFEFETPTTANYESLIGTPPPSDWVRTPKELAKRFSEEQLKDSIINALVSDKPINENFAKLDFGRKYAATPSQGYVGINDVMGALTEQIGVDDLNKWLATTMDGINGSDANVRALESMPNPRADLVAEMDKLLQQEKLEVIARRGIEDIVRDTRFGDKSKRGSEYNPETRVVTSVEGNGVYRGSIFSPKYPLMTNNEVFDLSNGRDNVLGGEYNASSAHAMQKAIDGGSASPLYISNAFDSKALEDAFVDSLNNGRLTVQLKFNDTSYVQNTDILAIRDALQMQGVDTNELVKNRVTSLRRPVDDTELNKIGLMTPEPVSSIVAHASEFINLDSFTVVRDNNYLVGINRPMVMQDPATGKKYVVKELKSYTRGWGQRATDQEVATQAFYRAMGVRASRPQRGYKTDSSALIGVKEYVVSEYIEAGQDNYSQALYWDKDPANPIIDAVRHGLPADILLDHIDGPFNSGNVLVDENGNIIRIDGGGALMWDPIPDKGPKGREGTGQRIRNEELNFIRSDSTTQEQREVYGIARLDGSFEGEGIRFSFDYFLNKRGWHWRPGQNGRTRILQGLTEDNMKQYTIQTVLPLTEDKIANIANAIIRDPQDRERIITALIARRKAILDRYGIEDNYVRDGAAKASQEQLSQFYPLWESRFDKAEDATAWLVSEGYPPGLEVKQFEESTSAQIDDLIRKLQAMEPAKGKSAADKINEIEEAQADNIQNGVDTTIYPQRPTNAVPVIKDPATVQFGDILTDDSAEGFKELGRVVFNALGSDGKRTVAYVDANKKVNFKTYNPSDTVNTVRYEGVDRPMESDVAEGAANREIRSEYQNQHLARSTAILGDIKNTYPNHVELENGDLVVASRDFTTAGGNSYKYEVVVHRKPNEEFVTYVRETPINAAGEAIGTTTVNKMSVQTHSSTHLKNQIRPLILGNSQGKGIRGRNPRNWFNQGNNREAEVINPGTGLPIPRSLAPEQLDTKYIGNTGIKVTGDAVKDALIGYVADLVDRKIDTGSLMLRLSSQGILSRSQMNDVIERIQANRAFPGVNQVPYVSRDGESIVRVGDRVRHYATDGTIKEGIVRKRRPLSVNQKRSGTYGYSDVLVVKFDGRAQGTPIVAKNLEILRRADGSSPSIGGETAQVITPPPFLPIPQSSIDDGIVAEDIDDRTRRYISASNGRSGRITTMPRAFASQNDTYSAQLWHRGDNQNINAPYLTQNFDDRNVAQAAVLNWLKDDPADEFPIVPQASRVESEDDLGEETISGDTLGGDTIERTASPEPLNSLEQTARDSIREFNRENDPSTYIGFTPVEGVDSGILKTYAITFDKKGKKALAIWLDSRNIGDYDQAKYIKLPKDASDEDAKEIIIKNAAERLAYYKEAGGKEKHIYELEYDGDTLKVELDFDEYNSVYGSRVSGGHFETKNGVIEVSTDRRKEHVRLIDMHLAGVEPSDRGYPIAFFLGGGPASGKGSFTRSVNAKVRGLRELYGIPTTRSYDDITGLENPMDEAPKAVRIDPDVIKITLPEVRRMHARQIMRKLEKKRGLPKIFTTGHNDSQWADQSHEESSLVAKLVKAAAMKKKLDIVYDGTGDGGRKSIAKKTAEARAEENGYQVEGYYMDTDLITAIASSKIRAEDSGRIVPESAQNDIFFNLSALLNPDDPENGNIASLFDKFVLIHRVPEIEDENGNLIQKGDFITVAEKLSKDKPLNIKDTARFAEILSLSGKTKEERKALVEEGRKRYVKEKARRKKKDLEKLKAANKDKLDESDLDSSMQEISRIRKTIEALASRLGMPTDEIASTDYILDMILDNKSMSEIVAEAKKRQNNG